MHFTQLLAVLGAATAVSAHPGNELFDRAANKCSAFSSTCKGKETAASTWCATDYYKPKTVSETTKTVTSTLTQTITTAKTTKTVTNYYTDSEVVVVTDTATVSSGTSYTTFIPVSSCTGSATAPASPNNIETAGATPDAAHRKLAKAGTASPPACFSKYTASSQISSACSCAGVTGATTTALSTITAVAYTAITTTTSVKTATTNTDHIVYDTITTTTTSTTTIGATATVSGFALAYSGIWGTDGGGAVNLNYTEDNTSILAFTLSGSNGTLLGLTGSVANETAFVNGQDTSGDFVRFGNSEGLQPAPVGCQIAAGSCLLHCTGNGWTDNYLYADGPTDGRDGLWLLAPAQTVGYENPISAPTVVAFPGIWMNS